MYRNILFITALASALALFAACSSAKHGNVQRLPGTWQLTPVTIDGSNKDWPAPYPNYDDKAMLGYAVSNDSRNLYITVETGDPATQLKILREGLTVWIDRTGRKDQVTAINYPVPADKPAKGSESMDGSLLPQGQEGAGGGVNGQRLALEDKVSVLLREAREYSLQGFKACNLQFPITENDTCGVIVRMSIDMDNEMVWEAVIPFKSFYYKAEIEKRDNGKPMAICIETTAAKRPAGQPRQAGSRGSRGGMAPGIGFGGMGMGLQFGGGRRGGGSAPQQDNMMEPLYRSTTTWKTFGLAYP